MTVWLPVQVSVSPGARSTGWAQVSGFRGETKTLDQMKKRVEYDLWYMENWNLWLDLKILVLTVPKLFKTDKAY